MHTGGLTRVKSRIPVPINYISTLLTPPFCVWQIIWKILILTGEISASILTVDLDIFQLTCFRPNPLVLLIPNLNLAVFPPCVSENFDVVGVKPSSSPVFWSPFPFQKMIWSYWCVLNVGLLDRLLGVGMMNLIVSQWIIPENSLR